MKISFPPREVKVIHADIELEVTISNTEYDELLKVFYEQESKPFVRLTVNTETGATATFENFHII